MIISTVVLLHFCKYEISNSKYILNNNYKFFAVYIYKNFARIFSFLLGLL